MNIFTQTLQKADDLIRKQEASYRERVDARAAELQEVVLSLKGKNPPPLPNGSGVRGPRGQYLALLNKNNKIVEEARKKNLYSILEIAGVNDISETAVRQRSKRKGVKTVLYKRLAFFHKSDIPKLGLKCPEKI